MPAQFVTLNETSGLHPCRRECSQFEKPKTCYYHFRMEYYYTLSMVSPRCACFMWCSQHSDDAATSTRRIQTILRMLLCCLFYNSTIYLAYLAFVRRGMYRIVCCYHLYDLLLSESARSPHVRQYLFSIFFPLGSIQLLLRFDLRFQLSVTRAPGFLLQHTPTGRVRSVTCGSHAQREVNARGQGQVTVEVTDRAARGKGYMIQ